MLRFHVAGEWDERRLRIERAESTRRIVPEVEALIDETWRQTITRPGMHLFDGPMCRHESWHVRDDELHLRLSTTSYRIFLGTNLAHPELADRYGRNVLANPVGVSSALVSRDGYLLMGVRNDRVAYYPDRIHPFAGAAEPADDLNLFAAVRRELREELGMTDADLEEIRCTGSAEDLRLRQPEMIFRVQARRTRAEIESNLDREEHGELWSIPAARADIEAAIRDPRLTPVAVAAMLLWGRASWGDEWFNRQAASVQSAP